MDSILEKINSLVNEYFDNMPESEFIPGKSKISLATPQYGREEVIEAIESLLSTWVTMGKKVSKFETMFSEYIGTSGSLMVNSGSSANLLALSTLASQRLENGIKPGDEIICPAVTWSTTVYPILNIGAVPVYVDVEKDSLNIDPQAVESAITDKTKAIMVVHLMGNPCKIQEIKRLCEPKGIHVIEDSCEAHGAKIGNARVGSFGTFSTFSFFLSHHITTVEGGMVLSNDEELLDIARSKRAHGWARDMKKFDNISKEYPNIDKRFLFYETGFNFRPTEIQGAFGIHQLKKLDDFVTYRRNIANEWNKKLSTFKEFLILPEDQPGTTHSYFAYPLTLKNDVLFSRKELTSFLEAKLIETRPIAGGDLTQQPSAKIYDFKISGNLVNAKEIMKSSFFIGLHTGIGDVQQEYVINCFNDFFSEKMRK